MPFLAPYVKTIILIWPNFFIQKTLTDRKWMSKSIVVVKWCRLLMLLCMGPVASVTSWSCIHVVTFS
jgi:hypothetical protein